MPSQYKIYIWKRAPFLRLLIPLIAGILLQNHLTVPVSVLVAGCLIGLMVFLTLHWLPSYEKFRRGWLRGTALNMVLCLLGALAFYLQDIRHQPGWYGHFSHDYLQVAVVEPVQIREKTVKVEANVQFSGLQAPRPVTGRVILYLKTDSLAKTLRYGDVIWIKNKLTPIKSTGNPGAFDYATYMRRQNVYHTAYLTGADYTVTSQRITSAPKKAILQMQAYLLAQLDRYIGGEKERALAKALVIGHRLELDRSLIQAYSRAGVVHLIAISGLHLGILYGMLLFFTSKIACIHRNRVLETVLVLICIWLFAVVTGAAPSVMRAACMFSFMSVGKLARTNTSVYNSLCASAFMLLIFNPFLLWHIGFQLSYLAVAGIVILQRPLYHLWIIQNRAGDFLWQMGTVSIAAQVFTLPACLYYFHQVPLLFLAANILLIPVATVVLWATILLLVVSPLPGLAIWLGVGVEWLIHWMNSIVLWFNALSFIVWDGIHVSLLQTILLFGMLIAASTWLIQKKSVAFLVAAGCVFLFFAAACTDHMERLSRSRLIVYNFPKAAAVEVAHRGIHYFFADSAVMTNRSEFAFHILPARVRFRPQKLIVSATAGQNRLIRVRNDYVLHCISPPASRPSAQNSPVRYLILSHDVPVNLTELKQRFPFERVVFDASNSYRQIKKWKKACDELNLPYYSVPDQGAFIADI